VHNKFSFHNIEKAFLYHLQIMMHFQYSEMGLKKAKEIVNSPPDLDSLKFEDDALENFDAEDPKDVARVLVAATHPLVDNPNSTPEELKKIANDIRDDIVDAVKSSDDPNAESLGDKIGHLLDDVADLFDTNPEEARDKLNEALDLARAALDHDDEAKLAKDANAPNAKGKCKVHIKPHNEDTAEFIKKANLDPNNLVLELGKGKRTGEVIEGLVDLLKPKAGICVFLINPATHDKYYKDDKTKLNTFSPTNQDPLTYGFEVSHAHLPKLKVEVSGKGDDGKWLNLMRFKSGKQGVEDQLKKKGEEIENIIALLLKEKEEIKVALDAFKN